MAKTVIFGGTFNPVHLGHVKMAETVSARDEVEEILIIPLKQPVHKSVGNALASEEHRVKMCQLAFLDIPKVVISDIEIKSKEKNYSITTIRKLKEEFPNKEFAFLLGGDSLIEFNKWYQYLEILKEVELYVFGRGSCSKGEFDAALENLRKDGGRITVIDKEIPNISSSEIRQNLKTNKSLKNIVSLKVAEYIIRHGLYLEEKAFND